MDVLGEESIFVQPARKCGIGRRCQLNFGTTVGFLNIGSCLHVNHYQVHLYSKRQRLGGGGIWPDGHFIPENPINFWKKSVCFQETVQLEFGVNNESNE